MRLSSAWIIFSLLSISSISDAHANVSLSSIVKEKEGYRQSVINEHTYWRWTGEVRREGGNPEHGLIVALRGWNEKGSFDSWGWFNNKSEKQWVITHFVTTDGKEQEWKISTKENPEVKDMPLQSEELQSRLALIFGSNVTDKKIQEWITGSSSEGKVNFVQDLSGSHLQSSVGSWGKIYFPQWVPLATTDGKPLTLPTYWVLDNLKGQTVLTVSSFEAYSKNDLPYPQWPYQKPAENTVENIFSTPALDIPADQLDYDKW